MTNNRCPNCGACQECGHAPQPIYPQPYVPLPFWPYNPYPSTVWPRIDVTPRSGTGDDLRFQTTSVGTTSTSGGVNIALH